MQMEKEVLECVLKNRRNENGIQKILSVESSPAVGKFQNFLSMVTRLKLRVVLGNGRLATRYLISKENQVMGEMQKNFLNDRDPFKVEIMMYEKVLKEMEYLMEEFEDVDEPLWCNMVHSVPSKTIILEDLQAGGYKMLDRSSFLDLDHGLMTVHALGKFHALSKILEERGAISKDNFKPWCAFNNEQMVQFGFLVFRTTLGGIKLHWDSHWNSLADRIDLSPEKFRDRMKAMGEVELSFNVVCHGDCNKNNLMFKYGRDKQPTAVKFIDFQLSFYGSPCFDLNHIMYCCLHPSQRRNNFNLFMKTYHESLCNTLDSYNFKGSKPSLEDIIEGMETYSFLGLWTFLTFVTGIALGEEMEKYVDMEKVMATGGQEGFNLDMYKLESVKEMIRPDFEDFVNKFF